MSTEFKSSTKSRLSGLKIKDVSGVLIILIVYIAVVAFVEPSFMTVSNWLNIVRQISTVGIMASAITLVMLTGEIDLSSGSILSLTACISCSLVGRSPALAIILPIVVGVACGLVNGLLVGKLKLNSFVLTLGMLSVYQSLALLYSNNAYLVAADNTGYKLIGQGFILGIPIPALIFLMIALIYAYVLSKTVFGTQIYAVGCNRISARFSGIGATKTIILTYVLAGLTTGLSGVVLSSRIMSAQPKMGTGYEFDVITAIILGGLRITGGKGNIWGTMLGVLFIGVLKNGFVVMGITSNYQYLVQGLILIVAIRFDMLRERRN